MNRGLVSITKIETTDKNNTNFQWSQPLPKYGTVNIYFQNYSQSETTKTKYKGDYGVKTNTDPKIGISYTCDKEYNFTRKPPINFRGYYIYG